MRDEALWAEFQIIRVDHCQQLLQQIVPYMTDFLLRERSYLVTINIILTSCIGAFDNQRHASPILYSLSFAVPIIIMTSYRAANPCLVMGVQGS
jgi:hypothetical protein